jgi:hypothetical protein
MLARRFTQFNPSSTTPNGGSKQRRTQLTNGTKITIGITSTRTVITQPYVAKRPNPEGPKGDAVTPIPTKGEGAIAKHHRILGKPEEA